MKTPFISNIYRLTPLRPCPPKKKGLIICLKGDQQWTLADTEGLDARILVLIPLELDLEARIQVQVLY